MAYNGTITDILLLLTSHVILSVSIAEASFPQQLVVVTVGLNSSETRDANEIGEPTNKAVMHAWGGGLNLSPQCNREPEYSRKPSEPGGSIWNYDDENKCTTCNRIGNCSHYGDKCDATMTKIVGRRMIWTIKGRVPESQALDTPK